MINLEKIKKKRCQPSFSEELPLHHTSTPFFWFLRFPPLGEVIKIYFLSPLRREDGGSSYGRYYFGRYSSEPVQLVPLLFSRGRSTHYSDRLYDFSANIPRWYKDAYVNSFFRRTARLWNSLPIECFPLNYDLSGLKSRINRHLLTVGSSK